MVGFNVVAVAAAAALTLFSGADARVAVKQDSHLVKRNAPLLPSCLSYPNYNYVGCFYDSANPRALVLSSGLDYGSMTVDKCIAFCKGNNFKYAGLEYYGECFCGQSIAGSPADASNCQFPCRGAPNQLCGGNNYLSVYQDPTYPASVASGISDYVKAGCWSDNVSMRTLAYSGSASGSSMTTESCLAACKLGGYPFAGTEYSTECYCGVSLAGSAVQQPDSACTYPCAGNKGEVCGGSGLLNLYVANDLGSQQPCTVYPPGGSSTSSTPPPPSTSTSKPPTTTSSPPAPPTTTSSPPPPPTTTSKPPPSSTPPPPPPPPATITCVGQPGVGILDYAINVAPYFVSSLGVCGGYCSTTSGCKSFAYDAGSGACYLYNVPVAKSLVYPYWGSTASFYDASCITYPTTTPPAPPTTTTTPPKVTCVGKPGAGSLTYAINAAPFFVSTINLCASSCSTTSGCKSFAYENYNGACFLYNVPAATSLVTPDINSQAYFYDVSCTAYLPPTTASPPPTSTPPPSPPPTTTCVGKPGAGSLKYAINAAPYFVSSITACVSSCSTTSGCQSFAYEAYNGACFLYNALAAISLVTPDANSQAFFFDITCTTFTLPPPSGTTPPPALCTTTLPGKYDFNIGNWYAPTLPGWTDVNGCNIGAAQCKVQLGSCWSLAGWPASGNCAQYGTWCDSITSYCKTPSIWSLGSCSILDFKSKNPIALPPLDGSNRPITIVAPCQTTPTPTPTVVPVPTYAPICAQPNSPNNGYTSSSPIGGIWMPCLTCNNDKLDFGLGNVFKLFDHSFTSSCTGYKSTGVVQGCKDACLSQYNSCKGTYAQSCQGKIQSGSQDSYNSALTRCGNQYNDCLSLNSNPLGGGSACGGWNSGWTITPKSSSSGGGGIISTIVSSVSSLFSWWPSFGGW